VNGFWPAFWARSSCRPSRSCSACSCARQEKTDEENASEPAGQGGGSGRDQRLVARLRRCPVGQAQDLRAHQRAAVGRPRSARGVRRRTVEPPSDRPRARPAHPPNARSPASRTRRRGPATSMVAGTERASRARGSTAGGRRSTATPAPCRSRRRSHSARASAATVVRSPRSGSVSRGPLPPRSTSATHAATRPRAAAGLHVGDPAGLGRGHGELLQPPPSRGRGTPSPLAVRNTVAGRELEHRDELEHRTACGRLPARSRTSPRPRCRSPPSRRSAFATTDG